MKITVRAYAKINLLLDILGKLDSRYHDLYMIMQSVGLFDEVAVELTNGGGIALTCSESEIPTDERNIAHKAAESFFAFTGLKNPGLSIDIRKNIPHAAGLAGGSADGAAVIVALRAMLAPQLSDRDVLEIAAEVGSDVPFCALGGTMIAQGRGTVLSYMPQLELPNIVIVKPDCSVSTGAAYSAFDTAENVIHTDRDGAFRAVLGGDTDGLFRRVANVFEQFIHVHQRVDIKAVMRSHGAKCACMSGSGPSVFGIFEKREDAEACIVELKAEYPLTFLAPSVHSGVEITSRTP